MRTARMLLVVGLLFVLLASAFAEIPSLQLLAALGKQESGGDIFAIGDKQLPPDQWAYGHLQIRQTCIDDVNRRYGTHYRAEDCFGNPVLSDWVCQSYIAIHATKTHLGRKPTDKDMARIWNGGPHGWKKSSTQKYWKQVQQHLPKAKSRKH